MGGLRSKSGLSFLFESASSSETIARFSFLGCGMEFSPNGVGGWEQEMSTGRLLTLVYRSKESTQDRDWPWTGNRPAHRTHGGIGDVPCREASRVEPSVNVRGSNWVCGLRLH